MNAQWIRIGAPVRQWLADSDGGTYFGEVDANIPAPHRMAPPYSEELMDVLAKIWRADARKDGSVRIEVCAGAEAKRLYRWVDDIAYFARQNAGEDAHERGIYNSARATLRALDKSFGRL